MTPRRESGAPCASAARVASTGGSTPAPIYILRDGEIVSELNIGRDLGLPGFTHIHNAAFRVIEGRFFVLAHAWNPGNFAILEQVLD